MAFANKYTGSSLKKFDLIIDNQAPQSYSTFTINTPISGLKAGSHTIIVKSEYVNGITESDTCNLKITGTSASATLYDTKNNLNCYPNPSTNGFTIDIPGTEMASIRIFNLQGQQVFQATTLQTKLFINKNTLTPGMYLVQARDKDNNLLVKKIIIES